MPSSPTTDRLDAIAAQLSRATCNLDHAVVLLGHARASLSADTPEDELRAELAASRFDGSAGLPHWRPDGQTDHPQSWLRRDGTTYHAEVWLVWCYHSHRSHWHWRVYSSWEPASTLAQGASDAPRAAMRAADRELADREVAVPSRRPMRVAL